MRHHLFQTAFQTAADTRADEELMVELAHGRHEALGPLYTRYAGLVFHLAARSLERPAAEELVQEVFLAIWRGAGAFEPDQGGFKPWLVRLTRWKLLNELRRQRRRPREGTSEADLFAELAEPEPGPEERAAQDERAEIVRAAVRALPPKERQAVAMAFLEQMTHEQVAQRLAVPLGTAKTRIRSGLHRLRLNLAPVAASLLGLALALVGLRSAQIQQVFERDERALALVTRSDIVPLRLLPTNAELPASAHATYRGHAGTGLAVLTVEGLPAPPAGQTYVAWAGYGQTWVAVGSFTQAARLVAESPELAKPPDALEITLESQGTTQAPHGQVMLAWPPAP